MIHPELDPSKVYTYLVSLLSHVSALVSCYQPSRWLYSPKPSKSLHTHLHRLYIPGQTDIVSAIRFLALLVGSEYLVIDADRPDDFLAVCPW